MIANAVIVQPNSTGADAIPVSAYRQVRYQVEADAYVGANQPMYADIYFRVTDVFYKTITSYTINRHSTGNSLFTFDIQDALQEFLTTHIPAIPANSFERSDLFAGEQMTIFKVYFRGSTFVGDVLVPEATAPTQATATTPAISTYSGLVSNKAYGVMATILPDFASIYDNNSPYFEQYLNLNTITGAGFEVSRIYPLSNLPVTPFLNPNTSLSNSMWRGYNAAFPVAILEYAHSGILDNFIRSLSVYVIWGSNGDLLNYRRVIAPVTIDAKHLYYIPCGLADLELLLSGVDYALLTNVTSSNYYRMAIKDEDTNFWCFFSPMYKVATSGIETECLWFQNSFGHFEQVTFVRAETQFNTTSSQQFKPYTQTYNSAGNSPSALRLGRARYNVRSNDVITLTGTFSEGLMPWLSELFASGFIMQQNAEYATGFRTVVILDGSYTTRQTVKNGRVNYEVSIKVRPAIEYTNLRN